MRQELYPVDFERVTFCSFVAKQRRFVSFGSFVLPFFFFFLNRRPVSWLLARPKLPRVIVRTRSRG